MNDTTERDHCIYCDRDVTALDTVPAVEDDDAWSEIAAEHAPDCEWVTTRAHRINI